MSSTLWFTIITMTSVGYGGIIASTPIGRSITICSTIVGAFLLSLLVAIITDWFVMEERQTKAIHRMEKDRNAAASVRAAIQYNLARAKRYRLLNDGNEENEHIPTVEELKILKERVYVTSRRFRATIKVDPNKAEQLKKDRERKLMKK